MAGLDKVGQKKSENGQSCSFSFHQVGSYLEPGVIGAVRAGRPHCLGKGRVRGGLGLGWEVESESKRGRCL